MPENTSPHPGSWIGDLGNEWKTAKPPEKVLIVGAIVATIGIALYLHGKSTAAPNQPGAQDTSGLGGIPANFQQGGGGGGGGTTSGGGITAQPPVQNPPAVTTGTTKAPVNKQTTIVTKTYAGGANKPSAPSVGDLGIVRQPSGVTFAPGSPAYNAYLKNVQPKLGLAPIPKPRAVQTPAQTYLQVGNNRYS